jgi:hypothetical protein
LGLPGPFAAASGPTSLLCVSSWQQGGPGLARSVCHSFRERNGNSAADLSSCKQ